jgi:hypothetical protein
MDIRDIEIHQAKMAIQILSGMRKDSGAWPTVRCPGPNYEADNYDGGPERS